MQKEGNPVASRRTNGRRVPRAVFVIAALIAAIGLLFAVLVLRDNDGPPSPSRTDANASPPPSQTTTTIDLKRDLIARLNAILARRELAYRKRDASLLKEIYTVDCPCLESDSNAIRELISEDYIWVGGETSIRIRRLEKVSERMWTIIADFVSEPLRIESESGRLIRKEPQGSDLFQFVLARPTGSTQWLLGRATSYEGG